MRLLNLRQYFPTLVGLIRNMLARQRIFPFYASFKLTSRCEFNCPFCNVRQQRTNDLPTESVKKILDNLSRSSVLMTSFEGGEPLLRPDLEELLRYARRCSFYLLFTTSSRRLMEYPLEEYSRYIDFFHISIDEGHNNLDMFRLLPKLTQLPTQISVQTVVTKSTINTLDEKVKLCSKAGAAIVIIPATHMDNTEDFFPDIYELEKKLRDLKKKYPFTIHTPDGYFEAYRKQSCSSASIIISSDGRLYYPCHILGEKGPDLTATDLNKWLVSKEALHCRKIMQQCKRNCGWYQYYSIESYLHLRTVFDALAPMLFQKKRTCNISL